MALWEYKVITSGKGGFASPALLEKFLNDLGREEWEIIEFQTQSDNFLAFTGLARRPTQRDWTLEDAAAAAAKAEADKLRAEFEAKFKAGTSGTSAAEEAPAGFLEEKVAPDDGFRKPVDTSHDAEAEEESKEEDDWDKLTAAEEDELPTFFEAIRPHMRRNQRGPGMSVGLEYLAKKWDQSEEDLKGALIECGFTIPEDEDAKLEYLESEGDLYWLNVNRRGELWINTKEKPRPVFRMVKAQKAAVEEPAKPEPRRPEEREQKTDREERGREQPSRAQEPGAAAQAEAQQPPASDAGAEPVALPTGTELLDRIRPLMRRNRRGPGGSGSTSFLSRALKCREADLVAAFKLLGLVVPSSPNEKTTNVEIENQVWWLNVDSRGNIWINGREKKTGEAVETAASAEPTAAATEAAPAAEAATAVPGEAPPGAVPAVAAAGTVPVPEVAPASDAVPVEAKSEPVAGVLDAVRLLLKETRTGAIAGQLERVAEADGKSPDEFTAMLVAAGLVVPEKPREKPVFVEHGGEIFWLNRNAKGELWLNAKASKFAGKKSAEAEHEASDGSPESGADEGAAGKKPRRSRGRRKPEAAEPATENAEES